MYIKKEDVKMYKSKISNAEKLISNLYVAFLHAVLNHQNKKQIHHRSQVRNTL